MLSFGNLPYILVLLALLTIGNVKAQSDSAAIAGTRAIGGEKVVVSDTAEPHSPRKATILSAVCPGAGQIYNKKYWKLPLVYGGIGVSIYLGVRYGNDYRYWREEYRLAVDGNPDSNGDYTDILSEAAIRDNRDTYRRWMELSYITAGLFYVLQIVDANVDAHLMEFDVSDDLSLRWEPHTEFAVLTNQPTVGLRLQLRLK
jgi:hypothetical protein